MVMTSHDQLVSVIIPAYNAAAYIGETISSVTNQTHQNLDIIVIDDGSSDATTEIVKSFIAADHRIRLISQTNGGVARARNRGIETAHGDFIAPIDADDLWHPEKIEKQLRVFGQTTPRTGLVYCWSSTIDESGYVYARDGAVESYAGNVFLPLIVHNFIGNASAPLMRRDAVLEVGGYDPGLRDQRAQGVEDSKIYLAIAERYEFAFVPERLVGYRRTVASMSCNVQQMKRSHDLVIGDIRRRHPELPAAIFRWSEANICFWLAVAACRTRQYSEVGALLSKAFMQDPRLIARPTVRHIFGRFAIRACGQLLRRAPSRTSSSKIHFLDQNPGGETDLAILSWVAPARRHWMMSVPFRTIDETAV
jgi:glycosyltransferase involved in cell wall biosynthesis